MADLARTLLDLEASAERELLMELAAEEAEALAEEAELLVWKQASLVLRLKATTCVSITHVADTEAAEA